MWETFISWYINNYLGKYVENLNAQQLSFALRQGELELENVPLKKTIFRSWGLPIEVKSGIVGRIKIEFNLLKYFRNEPVLISIDNVYLVAGPLNLAEWDPVEEAALAHETKMSALDSQEGRWKAQFDLASNSSSYYSSLYFSSMQIGASIVTKFVENLQLNVHNVHIRFEEEVVGHHLAAFGVTLKSLTAQSCDSNWKPFSTSSAGISSDCSFKTLQLTEFAIYCDPKAEKFSNLNPVDLIDSMNKITGARNYLLCPVSAEARISKNNSSRPLATSSKPRFDVELSLDRVPLKMSDAQFRTSFHSYKSFSRLYRNCRLRHYRPFTNSPKEAPLLWWKYAVRAILAFKGYRRRTVLTTIDDVLQRARDNVKFVEAYEQHLRQELLSGDLRKLKDRMETELHYDEIIALREVAMRRLEYPSGSAAAYGRTPNETEVLPSPANQIVSATSPVTNSASSGVFSYIFPSWSNWLYSAESLVPPEPTATAATEEFENEIIQLRKSESELDESILVDVKSFGRDALLARFKFVLKKGVVTLSRSGGQFLEMDFFGVDISTELRPRSGAHNFNISLSSLVLRDCSTKSLIVSPHSTLPTTLAGKAKGIDVSSEPIFKLSYDRRPHKKIDNRITLTTKPMDLVIYPVLWKEVTSFFACSDVEDYLEVSQNRYEMMKEKTKEELRTYWGRLINSRTSSMNGVYHSSWEISLDISAPQIVINSSDLSKEPSNLSRQFRNQADRPKGDQKFIVFDLGRFRFTNVTDGDEVDGSYAPDHGQLAGQDVEEDDDENEEFMTPCSSPVPEKATSEGDSESNSSRPSIPDLDTTVRNQQSGGIGLDFSESLGQLQAKLYKRYKLEITDIQVIVVEGKSCKDGSWKIANSRCTSLLHLVDRFSINLQLERRLVYSEDPEWPALTVRATLPKLNLHLSKSKVLSIRSVLSSYLGVGNENVGSQAGTSHFNTSGLNGSQNSLHDTSVDHGQNRHTEKPHSSEGNELFNCKLFLAQFTIQSVAVEIQSRGRSIAELQITGARTTLTKWTKNTSISFVLHSILLVDAVQTFGPDFELLLASHKHVSMDSVSGSLLDSDPTSPMSPQSPSSPLPFAHPKPYGGHSQINQLAIPSELHSALLNSLLTDGAKHFGEPGCQSPTYDIDALITAELMLVNTGEEDVAILSVLFNNLDVIANPETLVEIYQFLQEITPDEQNVKKTRTESGSASGGTLLQSAGKWKVETSFDFNRLNILLLRGMVGKDGNRSGRKIATATACDARVGFSLSGNVLKVSGSLGGLQVLNLTPEGKYHQRVLSVGMDPLIDDTYNIFSPITKPRQTACGSSNASALDFSFEKSTDSDSDTIPVFTMRMASVIYTHCPIFLIDLKKCVDEFQVPLGTKLKSAAAQIAMGFVRQDSLHGIGAGGGRSPYGSFSVSLDKLSGEEGDGNYEGPRNPGIKVDITFENPVIALPRSRTSSEVLVANLGQITIFGNGADEGLKSTPLFNGRDEGGRSEFTESFIYPHTTGVSYTLLIRDVSLYSLDLQERWSMIDNLRMTYPTSNRNTLIRAQELYYCDPSMAKPILHNTVLQFVVEYGIPETTFFDADHERITMNLEDDEDFSGPKLRIQGRVVNPLKVSVTPGQYAQVLDSLGNVAAGEDDFLQGELKVESIEVLKGRWKEELSQAKIPTAVHLPSPTRFGNDSISISATFEVPEVIVELVLPEETVMNGEIPQLSLSCSELSFECEKKGFVMDMKVCLKSLTLEDTSVSNESHYRLLAMSQSSEIQNTSASSTVTLVSSALHRNQSISTSCPDLVQSNPITVPVTTLPHLSTPYFTPSSIARTETSSLPDTLDPDDIFSGRFASRQKSSTNRVRSKQKRVSLRDSSPTGSNGPATPPPSPRPMDVSTDNLVTIQIVFVDRKSPEFLRKYKGIHKSTNVEFNTLDVVLTPSTFICLRRFFSEAFAHADFDQEKGLQTKQTTHGNVDRKIYVHSPNHDNLEEVEKNTEMEISIKALRMKLAELSGTIGEVEVTDVMCRILNQGNSFYGVDGRMGSLQVKDVSPQAGKYPVKFIFQGKQALNFDYYRKGTEAKFRLEMASVLYIHTHRFYSEFWALVSSIFGRTGKGENEVPPSPSQPPSPSDSPLVILNIQAGAPVIFLPYSSTSTSLLVADLGHLSVRNKFMAESDAGRTFDYISVDLLEMDLYSAELGDETKTHSRQRRHGDVENLKTWIFDTTHRIFKTASSSSLLKNKCALNLKVKRLLNRSLQTSPTQASLSIQGTLSAVFATLNLEKYKLIRGLLQYNIGEQFEPIVTRPSSPHKRRQSMELSTVIARQAQASAASARVELTIELDLVNVTVEIIKDDEQKLSRVDFLRSRFTFSNSSDGTRDIDLASQEILVSDIRSPSATIPSSQKTNVFTNILQQSMTIESQMGGGNQRQQDGPSTSSFKSPTRLRAEVHLRETQRASNVTILLNNMRLMLILDWWIEVQSFLSEHIPEPPPLLIVEHVEVNSDMDLTAEKRLRNISPLLNRSKELMSPVTVSAGIVTKRAPILDVPDKTFYFKLNVSDCELVVVEDNSVWDTNAIILKMTAALTYRPHLERPISCNIMESELFSCVLGIESETALSILDPTNVSIEVVRVTKAEPQGILDATLSPSTMDKILKIKSTQISLRLSYYDMRMFLQLLERFSKEAQAQLMKHPSRQNQSSVDDEGSWSGGGFLPTGYTRFHEQSLSQLLAMGFSREDSCEALERCEGRVEEAAILLSTPPGDRNHSPTPPLESERIESCDGTDSPKFTSGSTDQRINGNGKPGIISGIEVKCTNLSICVIDDCKDADVPLVELNLGGLELLQNCLDRTTTAEAIISVEYYNRQLCGWEPLVEPWKCSLALQQNERGQLGKYSPSSEFPTKAPELEISLTSSHVLNINFTSTLLALYKTVSSNWSEDAYGHQDKRRSPFVPFILKNDTGSILWFSTIISNQEEVLKQQKEGKVQPDGTRWIQVGNGATQTFSFEGRGKLRHRNTHQLKMHQLIVRVNGWFDSNPVSVDRVGTYFRDVIPVSNIPENLGIEVAELPTTRLVFEVSLHGSAQKLVRIRSALMVKNTLPQTMELKLENTIIYPAFEMIQTGGGSYCTYIPPHQTCPIPLHSVCSQIWIRPILSTEFQHTIYSYCSKPLPLGRERDAEGLRTCTSLAASNRTQPYRFCVAVKRDEFPADIDEPKSYKKAATYNVAVGLAKRANLISILSPLTIINLLPYEVAFEIREHVGSSNGASQIGHIAAGKKHSVTNVDTTDSLEISFSTENFPNGTSLAVSTSSSTFVARLKLLDTQKRPLYLNACVSRGDGGTITVRISCQYWIVNKSGLPLIIKQEGVNSEAAGQFQEHEHARMMVPLLYSFYDPEGVSNVTLRVGTGLHPPPAKPQWCRSFPLQNGTRVRKLNVSLSHSQPDVVYLTGLEVSDGKGRYRDSKVLTIAPRFIIENRSSRRMQICQRNFATSFLDPGAEATHLTLPPGCTLPFHWPRLDKDQLLCIRLLDVKGAVWSGGFPIENVLSFHINIRGYEGACHFVRVETVVEGATYFVVFSDTDQLPPPFRIDNLSLVPIIIHQSNVGDERLKLVAKPSSSIPYAWDEPTQPSNLTLAAPGGTSAIARMDDTNLGLVAHMTYENFFYIALTVTFPRDEGDGLGTVSGMETLQLVLDVPEGCKIVLRKKEAGNRNQLWRVNANGLIEHEGSSPPRDIRKEIPQPSLVLDVAGQAIQPTQWVPLMLRKPDKRRASTQHWEFTREGRLKCVNLNGMFVQAKDGFGVLAGHPNRKASAPEPLIPVAAWQMWNEVVFGPPQPVSYVRTDLGIPAEEAVGKQKLRPGSGRLSVYIDTDGPTRVLRIIDTEHPPLNLLNHTFEGNSVNAIPKMSLNLDLQGGLGLSVISCNPREELVYAFLSKPAVQWVNTEESETVSISVENFQIDNQLKESEKCVAVYVTPPGRAEDETRVPALSLKWKRLKSKLNAHLYKEWDLFIKPLNMIIEEKLLLELCKWVGIGTPTTECAEDTDDAPEVQKALINSTSLTTKRFYFGHLKIFLNLVRLSVLTSSRLPVELALIKRRLGLTLIRFEETLVELDAFHKQHPFETFDFLLASILKHYKDELLSQALLVLGSVDFLGNPVGFVNDVTVGVSTLIQEGSFDALFRNVTHGISNSAAKVTGSLGDGLTRTLTLDSEHEEWRRSVRDDRGSAVTPLNAGIKGLLIGLGGGLTSIFNQTYKGAMSDGFTGVVSGLGKGIVGTVTKPAVGVLDLAAGMALAVRDNSRSASRMLPNRLRRIRVATGNGGLLPPYSEASAAGQELMFEINGRNHSTVFIGCESVKSGKETYWFLVSSDRVTVFTLPKSQGTILDIPIRDLLDCRLLEVTVRGQQPTTPTATYALEKKLVIEFTAVEPNIGMAKRQVTVENEQVAKTIVQEVNYARILCEEMRHSQINKSSTNTEE